MCVKDGRHQSLTEITGFQFIAHLVGTAEKVMTFSPDEVARFQVTSVVRCCCTSHTLVCDLSEPTLHTIPNNGSRALTSSENLKRKKRKEELGQKKKRKE